MHPEMIHTEHSRSVTIESANISHAPSKALLSRFVVGYHDAEIDAKSGYVRERLCPNFAAIQRNKFNSDMSKREV